MSSSADPKALADLLYLDLQEYDRTIASYCTPECPHSDPYTICDLDTLSPNDCRDSELKDLARWLIANGWTRAGSGSPVVCSTSAACGRRVVKRTG